MLPVVILAGGLATRLRPLTVDLPKAMVNINGKPFIYWQLKKLALEGFNEIIISIGHLGDIISNYVGDGKEFNLNVKYFADGNTQLGTGGAIAKVAESLDGKFLVTYGDSYLPISFTEFASSFEKSNYDSFMTMTTQLKSGARHNILYRRGRIVRYSKNVEDTDMNFLDYGLLGFDSKSFQYAPKLEKWDLDEIINELISRFQIEGIEVKEQFFEIGTFEGISEFTKYLEKR